MKRAQPLHALDHAADERADALLHFARGLVGEGDGQDLAGQRAPCRQDVGEARGEHPRLAGARARQHQHRAVERQHRLALALVQPLQIGGLARRNIRRLIERRVQRIAVGVGVATHDSGNLAA